MEWINGIFISSWKPWRIKNVIDELSKGVMLLRLMQALGECNYFFITLLTECS